MPIEIYLCLSSSLFVQDFLFTSNSEILRPQTVNDVVQEEALIRQGLANETVALQGMIQDVTQNCPHWLLLVH